MLPGPYYGRRRPRWHRWRTRVWLFTHRYCRLITACAALLVLFGCVKTCHYLVIYRRRLAWRKPPLPPEEVEAFVNCLWLETQRSDAIYTRGIVLPLFDEIALLGFSLILELRRLNVTLPVEIAHCGDLSMAFQRTVHKQDDNVVFLDVCALAANATTKTRPVFCVDLAHCHHKFRSFQVKVLAVVYSHFQEIMLLDADTLFFQSPMSLWETHKYKTTGTLFFNDRISYEMSYLAKRAALDGTLDGNPKVGALHFFLAGFNVTPYSRFEIIENDDDARPPVSRQHLGLDFGFQPSAFLLDSHVWRLRSGHQMDSSLVLWNKQRQPRATAILASLISLNGFPTAPSYGDKELYWLASELAETAYAFSDFAVGALGWELLASGHHNDGVLCGDALQYYPVQRNLTKELRADAELLYMNSDNILEWGRDSRRLYRTAARPAELYSGSFIDRKLPQTCPFNVTTMDLTLRETQVLKQRQQYYDVVVNWMQDTR